MHDTAFVSSIDGKKIIVVPLIKGACLSCKQGCAKRGNPFEVINPHDLPVKVNSIVKIGTSKREEFFQAFSTIVFPIFCAVLFYFCSVLIGVKFGKKVSDGLKSFVTLLGFATGALIAFFSAKIRKNLSLAEITEIVS